MELHSTYYGVHIYRQSATGGLAGYRLPWVAVLDPPHRPRLAADTLVGLRSLIRSELEVG